MVACLTRSLHLIWSLASTWSGQNFCWSIWQHCPMMFFFSVPFSFSSLVTFLLEWSSRSLVIWLCGHPSSAFSSLWLSTHLSSCLSDDSFFYTALHLWHGQWRKCQTDSVLFSAALICLWRPAVDNSCDGTAKINLKRQKIHPQK